MSGHRAVLVDVDGTVTAKTYGTINLALPVPECVAGVRG